MVFLGVMKNSKHILMRHEKIVDWPRNIFLCFRLVIFIFR